jgi:hypothetical protein
MRVTCICGQPVEPGQILSGVGLDANGRVVVPTLATERPARQVLGHYECVLRELGPERMTEAIRRRALPNIDPRDIVGGRLRKFLPPSDEP